ncbi:MAG TPA: ribbon-helix-helix protein, CopG family [Candidatus Obscuribacterales bacterium]
MATSFRLDDELERMLEDAIKRTGLTRSQVIRSALSKYCAEILSETEGTPYERLLAAGFRPIDDNEQPDLAGNRGERRRRLADRARADNR